MKFNIELFPTTTRLKPCWFLLVTSMLLLMGCNQQPLPESKQAENHIIAPTIAAADLFDCLRENNGVLVSAHRGGPYPGYPENAIETLTELSQHIYALPEIDISETSDGVLFLFHDKNLSPKTTGQGQVDLTAWQDITPLILVDENGEETPYKAPLFDDVLEWASDKTVLQLDIKSPLDAKKVVAAVKAFNASTRVIYISYTLEQALLLQALDPKAMVSVSVADFKQWQQVKNSTLNLTRVIAFMGFKKPDVNLIKAINNEGVEVIFATLGGENSIDNQIAQGQSDISYQDIIDAGVEMIATDRPLEVFQQLDANMSCLTGENEL